MANKYDYDVIIVGAGIGGLVCGCYLAKAGMRVLIIEKNNKPGGYCTSFTREGYNFDACVHSFGSLRKGGTSKEIFEELGLERSLEIKRSNPSDIIIAPDYKVSFWNDSKRIIEELIDLFPNESKGIKDFFVFLNKYEGISLRSSVKRTFENLLNEYFKDDKLKAIFSFPIFGSTALPPSRISTFKAVTIFKEFMLDGGYFPKDGIQKLPDVLLKKYKDFGGEFLNLSKVTKINLLKNTISRVEIEKGDSFTSKYVVSDVDPIQLFSGLIQKDEFNTNIRKDLDKLKTTASAFIVYLGLKKTFKDNLSNFDISTIWSMDNYDVENMYKNIFSNNLKNVKSFWCHLSNDKRDLSILTSAQFNNKEYWEKNRDKLANIIIEKAARIFPDLVSNIDIKETATPSSLYNWTLNYQGACYGWECLSPEQKMCEIKNLRLKINNLFLVGHWAYFLHGVTGVSYHARACSKLILNKTK